MKKYKHKKLGYIAELASHSLDYNIITFNEIQGTLPKWVIENSNDWEEVKEPLFTTEDGIEIYNKEQIVYSVNTKSFLPIWETIFRCVNVVDYCKIFSNKEAAEKYIDDNKPRFSKKQIEETLTYNHGQVFPCYLLIDEEQFRQKLGL